jgi:hypothetical protein
VFVVVLADVLAVVSAVVLREVLAVANLST